MGLTSRLRVHFLNPDERLLAEAEVLRHPAIDFALPAAPAATTPIPPDAHVIVVCVETAASLDQVSLVLRQAGGRPVLAMAGKSFAGRSLEYVLLQAELRGAAATLVRPFDAHELAVSAMAVWTRFGRSDPPDETHRKVG